MYVEVFAPFLHPDEYPFFPDQIGKAGAAFFFFFQPEFEFSPRPFEAVGVAKGRKQAIEVNLGFTFFVAPDVLLAIVDKFL